MAASGSSDDHALAVARRAFGVFEAHRVRFCWTPYEARSSSCAVFVACFDVLSWYPDSKASDTGWLEFRVKRVLLHDGTVTGPKKIMVALRGTYTPNVCMLYISRNAAATPLEFEYTHEKDTVSPSIDLRRTIVLPIVQAPPANDDIEGPLEACGPYFMKT